MGDEFAVGSRLVVRHRLRAPDPLSGAHLSDVVGDLVAVDDTRLVVRTRHGDVVVDRSRIIVTKVVPPRPSRRGAPHRALSVDDLERVKVGAWPAVETARLGDWILRHSGGLTHRGSSALVVGEPDRPLPAALDAVERWYAERSAPPDVALPGPTGFVVAADPVGADLARRGWVEAVRSTTMTAAVADVLAAARTSATSSSGARVEVSASPPPGWLRLFHSRRGGDAATALAILTGSPEQWFASVVDGAETIARARLAICAGWAGLSAVEVLEPHRRHGLATAMLVALLERAHGVRSVHLDVESDNAPARTLYRAVGFSDHHEYVNLVAPEGR